MEYNTSVYYQKLCDWIPLEKLDFKHLSSNPNAISILEKNIDKIHWDRLSYNPNAISILEKNIDKVNWYNLSKNPNIFEIDYTKIKERTYTYLEEYSKKIFHPKNINTILNKYNYFL